MTTPAAVTKSVVVDDDMAFVRVGNRVAAPFRAESESWRLARTTSQGEAGTRQGLNRSTHNSPFTTHKIIPDIQALSLVSCHV
jgi:hypothetical protein